MHIKKSVKTNWKSAIDRWRRRFSATWSQLIFYNTQKKKKQFLSCPSTYKSQLNFIFTSVHNSSFRLTTFRSIVPHPSLGLITNVSFLFTFRVTLVYLETCNKIAKNELLFFYFSFMLIYAFNQWGVGARASKWRRFEKRKIKLRRVVNFQRNFYMLRHIPSESSLTAIHWHVMKLVLAARSTTKSRLLPRRERERFWPTQRRAQHSTRRHFIVEVSLTESSRPDFSPHRCSRCSCEFVV